MARRGEGRRGTRWSGVPVVLCASSTGWRHSIMLEEIVTPNEGSCFEVVLVLKLMQPQLLNCCESTCRKSWIPTNDKEAFRYLSLPKRWRHLLFSPQLDFNVFNLLCCQVEAVFGLFWSKKQINEQNPSSQILRRYPAGGQPSWIFPLQCSFDRRPQKQLAGSFFIKESGADCVFSNTFFSSALNWATFISV